MVLCLGSINRALNDVVPIVLEVCQHYLQHVARILDFCHSYSVH